MKSAIDDDWALPDITKNDHYLELPITPKEARALDWLITLHSWDFELFERLKSFDKMNFRERIGSALIAFDLPENKLFSIEITKEELYELLVLVPNTFQLGSDDVGLSLKVKLYRLLLGKPCIEKLISADTSRQSSEQESESCQNGRLP